MLDETSEITLSFTDDWVVDWTWDVLVQSDSVDRLAAEGRVRRDVDSVNLAEGEQLVLGQVSDPRLSGCIETSLLDGNTHG